MSNIAVTYRQKDSQPWIGLPCHKMPAEATVTEMLDGAGLLGWDVRLEEIVTDARPVAPSYEVLRTNPDDGLVDRLAVVGQRYHEVQNEALAQMADAITDGDVMADAAGSYRQGRNVFMTFTLGENIVLDPNGSADEIGRYLTIQSSHDGSSGIVAVIGNMRIVCQNMLTANKAAALSMFKMRHTQNVEGRILDARTALGVAFKQNDAFEAEMQALIEAEMHENKFWNLVTNLFPKPEKDVRGSVKKWETKTDTIMGLWNGDTLSGLEDTGYKAYNALNEHLMWYGGVRDGNVENALVRASGFDDLTNKRNLSLYKSVLLAV